MNTMTRSISMTKVKRSPKGIYTCRCKWGSEWQDNTGYKNHIKSETHKRFVREYHIYYKEVDNQDEAMKQLLIENEKMRKELLALNTRGLKLKKSQKKDSQPSSTILTELD